MAGGSGSRLFPATAAVNKQLLPIHDKPMIFYPLTSLLAASIDEICIVCNALDVPGYLSLLGDGSQFGASITYVVQEKPEGIPQALVLASKFIGAGPVSLILAITSLLIMGISAEQFLSFRLVPTFLASKSNALKIMVLL